MTSNDIDMAMTDVIASSTPRCDVAPWQPLSKNRGANKLLRGSLALRVREWITRQIAARTMVMAHHSPPLALLVKEIMWKKEAPE